MEQTPFDMSNLLKEDTEIELEASPYQSLEDVQEQHPFRIGVFGPTDVGKTHFCLSLLRYLHDDLGLKPEQIKVMYIDCDGRGLIPLVRSPRTIVPKELWKGIQYADAPNIPMGITAFERAYNALEAAIVDLKKHVELYGEDGWKGSWIILDNESATWKSVRNWFAQIVYKQTEAERVADKRADGWGKKGVAPPYDQMKDFWAINDNYDNRLLDRIRDSGFNFIVTSLGRTDDVVKRSGVPGRANKEDKIYHPGGKKDTETKYDLIVHLYKDDSNTRRGMLWKSRLTHGRFAEIANLDFPKFMSYLKELEERERGESGEEEVPVQETPVLGEQPVETSVEAPGDESVDFVPSEEGPAEKVVLDEPQEASEELEAA